MAAEDYDDVPGFGGGAWLGNTARSGKYECKFCRANIKFSQRKAFNLDGTPHRCNPGQRGSEAADSAETPPAALFAMAAMNAIISAQIQKGGIDHIHHMNFHDVADAAWQAAAAMVSAEKNYRDEFSQTPF